MISFIKEDVFMRTSQFTRSLSVALPQDHFDLIKNITDEEKISMAEFVRKAVAAALEANQQKEEVM